LHNFITQHKIITKILIASVLCAILGGCGINSIRVDIIEKETDNEEEIISIQIPQIKGMSKEFCDALNEDFKSRADKRIEEFEILAEETEEKRNSKAKLTVTQGVTYNKKGMLSILGEGYEYTSGMTGRSTRNAVNINTLTEQRVYLEDLFNDTEYVGFINAKLEKMSQSDEYSDIWEKPVIREKQNEYFYFSGDGLVIFYPPYELSYYARGFVEFTIPYSELYGYLKPEYCNL